MSLPKRILFFSSFFLLSFFLFPQVTKAWNGRIHDLLCPPEVKHQCAVADSVEFKLNYPFGGNWSHLCLDNKPDCPARMVAKYYLKKYYEEGKKDPNLLAGAAHLLQDSYTPDHWYPMREYGGKIIIPFAPSWLTKTEEWADENYERGILDWNYSLDFQDKTIDFNSTYLDDVKVKVADFVAQEPSESLLTLENQAKNRIFWSQLRSFREILFLVIILLFLSLIFSFWRYFRTKKGKSDVMIISFVFLISVIILLLGYLFY